MNKKILSIICACGLTAGSVSAAPIDSITQNSENGNIVISGDFSTLCKYSVQVLKPGVTPESLLSADDDTILSSTQAILNNKTTDGKYKVEIPMGENAENGTYTIAVNSSSIEEVQRKTFTWYKLEEVIAVFESVTGSDSYEKLDDIFVVKENCDKLGVSHDMISELDGDKLDKAMLSIYNGLSKVEKVDDLKVLFAVSVTPLAVSSASTDEVAIEYITSNASDIGIAQNPIYTSFVGLNDDIKKDVASRLRIASISDVDTLISELEIAIFLSGIKYAGSTADVNSLLTANQKLFSANIDKYFSLTNTYSCDNAIMGQSFDNITALETAIATVLSKLGGNSGSGGGGSGSGGSGGSVGGMMVSPTEPVVDEKFGFDDLDSVEWARTAIEVLAEKGIVSGKGDRRFAPEDMVKREEIVKMLVGAFNITAEGNVPFYDVPQNAWYHNYVATAYNSGLVKGISESQFGTGTNITRQDMAVLVYRFLSQKVTIAEDGIVAFDDKVEISEYARNAIGVLREEGIISGVGENMFMPKNNCTRAQVAYIIYKALKYAGSI